MGYIGQKLWDIFSKTMGYIRKTIDILSKNYGIYWGKIVSYAMGYIWHKQWDIFGKRYGINWTNIMGYIMGYIG